MVHCTNYVTVYTTCMDVHAVPTCTLYITNLAICFIHYVEHPVKGPGITHTREYKHKSGNIQSLSYTSIGLTASIMNGTNQEIFCRNLDDNT